MATLDLNSLFGQDPRLLQQSMDLQMAKLSPEERLYMMGAQGGRAIGQGLGSLFGVDVEDPTIKKASALRALASEFDTTTADGLMQYAQAASKIDPRIGMLVSQQVQDMRAKQAAISKDEAAAQASLSGRTPADIQKAQRIAALKKAIPAYKQAGDTDTVKMLEDELEALTPADKAGSVSELGKLLQERAKLDPVKDKESYDAYNAKIKKLTTGGGIGSEIAAGLSPIMGAIAKGQAEKSGETGGAAVGKETAAIQGKYTALSSIKDALDVVERGIYAGGYGPMEEALAKYGAGVVGNKNRLVNTEEFRAYIGDVVIPRLQEFGGNDSVEELKYLRSVMAGETTLEKASIERILKNADKKIRSGIQRLEAQQKAIGKGEQLPVGPLGGKQFTTKSGVVYTKE